MIISPSMIYEKVMGEHARHLTCTQKDQAVIRKTFCVIFPATFFHGILYWFPIAALTKCHKLSILKQHKLDILHFWR